MRRQAGLSLIETVISIFVLATAVLIAGVLMQASFRYQTMARQRVEATAVAQKILAEVKAWAWTQSGGNYNYNGSWSAYQGAVRNEQGFRVRIDSSPRTVRLASPCSALEDHFGAEGRYLGSSVVPVRVTVEWGSSDSLSLFTYIGEPTRIPRTVVVNQSGGSLAANGISRFSATALDANGAAIEDMMFRWYLEPTGANPGMGSLLPPWGGQVSPPVAMGPRDGRTSSVKNSYRKEDGSWIVVGGDVSVQAAATGHGREVIGTRMVRLAP
jgi:type II secretory pathway pseudopilin PulG